MRSFLVLYDPGNESILTDKLIKLHIDYLKELKRKKYLILCGPFREQKGALFIMHANNKMELADILKKDPFIMDGYYNGFTIEEFCEANDENNWLVKS